MSSRPNPPNPPRLRHPSPPRRLAVGFAALTALTYGLIVLGSLVRAHHAGLACPDWPLCFGQWIPEIDLRVAFEFGHRVSAGSIGLLFVGLSIAALRRPQHRSPLRAPLAAAAGLLALQIVLGALTVRHLLASWTVTAHLLTGNAFALSLALISKQLFERAAEAEGIRAVSPPLTPALRVGFGLAGALLLAQLVLGGLVSSRYAGLACNEWPRCEAGVWIPPFEGAQALHLLHRWNAYALLAAVLGCAWMVRRDPPGTLLRRLGALAALICVAQIGAGVANVLLRLPVEITALHTGLAGLLALTIALAFRESWRRPLTGRGLLAPTRILSEGSG